MNKEFRDWEAKAKILGVRDEFFIINNESGITLFDYKGKATLVVIPPVDIIGNNSFLKNNTVREVIIPDCIRLLEDGCFYYCRGLEKITIGKGVEKIPRDAFTRCISLHDVHIPDNIKLICRNAFSNCNNLTSIDFNKVKYLENNAFEQTPLEHIKINRNMIHLNLSAFMYCEKLKIIEIEDRDDVLEATRGGYNIDDIVESTSLEKIIVPRKSYNSLREAFEYKYKELFIIRE